jgi:hypothetical protein
MSGFDSARAKAKEAIAKQYNPRLDLPVGETLAPSDVLGVRTDETAYGELTTVTLRAPHQVRVKRGSGDDVEIGHAEAGEEVDLRISGVCLTALWGEDPAQAGDRITLSRDPDSPPSRQGYSGAKNILYIRIPAGTELPQSEPSDRDQVPF